MMRPGLLFIVYAIYLAVAVSVVLNSCTHKAKYVDNTGSGYPSGVAAIILNKCAVSGCHNSLSYQNAGGLNLTTWANMFDGGEAGAVVVPFRPDFSTFCYFTNIDSSLGISLKPTMPYDRSPLSRNEYLLIRDWILSGAQSMDGTIRFADDKDRQKFYVANRLCNVVTVLDAHSMLQMRYVDVGGGKVQFPYAVKVAPDRMHWYVSFFSQADFVQQFDATRDGFVAKIHLGLGSWTSFSISSDSKYGWFVDNSSIGKVVCADLQRNVVLKDYRFNDKLKYPEGIALVEQQNKIYIGTQTGNFIYVVDISDPDHPLVKELPIDGSGIVVHQSSLDPVEFLVDMDQHTCYVACSASGEVFVLNTSNDSVMGKISLGSSPMGMATFASKLFVACPDDFSSFPGKRGSVVVVDKRTNNVIKRLYTGYQPYGIAIDTVNQMAAVVNANISSSGPASHHTSVCGSKNGNVTFIDINTLELISNKRLEVAVFPCSISAK